MGPAPRSARVPFSARGTSCARSISVAPPSAKYDMQCDSCHYDSISRRWNDIRCAIRSTSLQRSLLFFRSRIEWAKCLCKLTRVVINQFAQVFRSYEWFENYLMASKSREFAVANVKYYIISVWDERLNENARYKILTCSYYIRNKIIWQRDY